MKKIMLILLILLVVPIAFGAVAQQDFYRPYLQSSNFGGATNQDTYLLRSTSVESNLNMSNASSCSVTLGGSDFRGSIFTYQDTLTSYETHSLIVAYTSSIKQYTSDCTVLDTYTPSGTILSKVGVISGGRIGTDYYSPMFGFVYQKASDSLIYLQVLKLNNETSKLEYYSEKVLSSTSTDTSKYYGVAGGCLSSVSSYCSYDDRRFAYYDHTLEAIYIYDVGDSSLVSKSTGSTYINHTSTNNMLWYDDFDNDGWNEFLVISIGEATADDLHVMVKSYQPLTISPYYYNINYSKEVESVDSIDLTDSSSHVLSYAGVTLCQIGSVTSELEVCYSVSFDSVAGDDYRYYGYVNNNFTDGSFGDTRSLGENYWFMSPFTYDIDSDGDIDFCHTGLIAEDLACVDVDGNILENFNITHAVFQQTYPIEVLVTEIDQNLETLDLMFSDGEVEYVNTTDWTSTSGTDWYAPFTTAQYGQMYVQDINDNNQEEFIYIDDTYLKIYSMNDTAYVLMNFTEENEAYTNTTTAITDVPNQTADNIAQNIKNNIMLISALFLIIALMVVLVQMKIHNPLILAFAGIIGAIIAVSIGLISASVLVIIIISLLVLMLLVMFLGFRGGDE